jgi:hypothetical protein
MLRLVVWYKFTDCHRFLHLQGGIALIMEAVRTSETWVNFHQTARRNIPEDSHLHAVSLLFRLKTLFQLYKLYCVKSWDYYDGVESIWKVGPCRRGGKPWGSMKYEFDQLSYS